MNIKFPSLLYFARTVIFASLLCCLILMSDVVSSVVYLVAIAFNLCEYVVLVKYKINNFSLVHKVLFMVLDRTIVIMPLLFAVVRGKLAVWVILILVAFEIIINMYKAINFAEKAKKKIGDWLFLLYNLTLYISALLYMYNEVVVASYFVLGASVFAAFNIIYTSITFNEKMEDDEEEKQSDNAIDSELVDDREIRQNEIVE